MKTKTRVKRGARGDRGGQRTQSSTRDEQPALLKARGQSRPAPVQEPGGTPPAIDEPQPIEGPVEEDAHAPRPGGGPDTNRSI